MKKSNHLNLLTPLLSKKSFSARDAKELGISSALIAYYIKIGLITRLKRGVYQGVENNKSSFSQWSELVEISQIIPNGAVCLVTALQLYDITDEMPRKYWIAIPHGTSYKKIKHVRLTRFRNMTLGLTTISVDGVNIQIFDLERTLIDAFRLLSKEISIKALKMALSSVNNPKRRLDLLKLQNYAKILRFNIEPYLLTAITS